MDEPPVLLSSLLIVSNMYCSLNDLLFLIVWVVIVLTAYRVLSLRMQPARMMLCVAAVVVVSMTPQTQATFSFGALPAVASVGGLAALKVCLH